MSKKFELLVSSDASQLNEGPIANLGEVIFDNPIVNIEIAKPEFSSEDVWGMMTLEQKLTAIELRNMMAERFETYGVTKESLRIVRNPMFIPHPKNPTIKNVFTLLHIGMGVDIANPEIDPDDSHKRSFEYIMSKKNDKLFKFNLGGVEYDARKGMTSTAYESLLRSCWNNDEILPDTRRAALVNRDYGPPTTTMLTGNGLVTITDSIHIADRTWVLHRSPEKTYYEFEDIGSRSVRVRPAIIL
jgi:hypothetical protein